MQRHRGCTRTFTYQLGRKTPVQRSIQRTTSACHVAMAELAEILCPFGSTENMVSLAACEVTSSATIILTRSQRGATEGDGGRNVSASRDAAESPSGDASGSRCAVPKGHKIAASSADHRCRRLRSGTAASSADHRRRRLRSETPFASKANNQQREMRSERSKLKRGGKDGL